MNWETNFFCLIPDSAEIEEVLNILDNIRQNTIWKERF